MRAGYLYVLLHLPNPDLHTVIVSPNDLEVRLRANGIERLVLELQPTDVGQIEEALA